MAGLLVSPHFRVSEFAQKPRPGWGPEFAQGEPYPDDLIESKLSPLCQFVLEPIRAATGYPLQVISGWRSVEYNKRVYIEQNQARAEKGLPPIAVTTSRHSQGDAADIVSLSKSWPAGNLERLVRDMWLKHELTILGGLGLYEGFIHVDLWISRPGHLRRWNGSRTVEQTE